MLQFIKEQVKADKGFARLDTLDPIAEGFLSAQDKQGVVEEAAAKVRKPL